VVFGRQGASVRFENSGQAPAHFVLIAGRPIGEPVAQYGPFVMNTDEELRQAMSDYQLSRNGFEAAARWRSELGNA
jgi:redox-sensitive bicupin YhaK (pirin superfamily)